MEPDSVSICVATYGSADWEMLAFERAVPSALKQVPSRQVITAHDPGGSSRRGKPSLATARNAALQGVETDWVIFLDADDELADGYVEAMCAGAADVRAPMVRYLTPGKHGRVTERLWMPQVWRHDVLHDRCTAECLAQGNWVVIGACVRTKLLRQVGWHDFAWSEDWATWALCAKLGASFELVQDATYVAHVRPDSRNRGASQEEKDRVHEKIAYFIESTKLCDRCGNMAASYQPWYCGVFCECMRAA